MYGFVTCVSRHVNSWAYYISDYELIYYIYAITRLAKAWSAIERLSVRGKSDPSDRIKRNFFHAVVVSILLYGCTTRTLTNCIEKKLDGNCPRMLRGILNKSWSQHPTKQQLYGHLSPIYPNSTNKTCGILLDELIGDSLYGSLHMDVKELDDQLEC